MKNSKINFIVLSIVAFLTLHIYLTSCSKNRHCNDATQPYYCGKWNLTNICSSLPYNFVGSTYSNPNYFDQVGFTNLEQCNQYISGQYQYQYYECKTCYIENE